MRAEKIPQSVVADCLRASEEVIRGIKMTYGHGSPVIIQKTTMPRFHDGSTPGILVNGREFDVSDRVGDDENYAWRVITRVKCENDRSEEDVPVCGTRNKITHERSA